MNTPTYMVTLRGVILISGVSLQTATQICYENPGSLLIECKLISDHKSIAKEVEKMQNEDRLYLQRMKALQEQLKLPKELLNTPGVRVRKDREKYIDKHQMYLVREKERVMEDL